MKMNSLTLSLVISVSTASFSIAQMRDAVTSADLAKKFEKTHLHNPLKNLKKNDPKAADPSKTNQPVDILTSSDFLSFQGKATLVPKKAIMTIPKRFQDRIRFVPGSKIMTWTDFYSVNRGWIKTHEVTRAQAQGVEPFDEEVVENLEKSSVVVVATYKGGPISVLPPKEPEVEEAGTDDKPKK